jgi:hypothetical protein
MRHQLTVPDVSDTIITRDTRIANLRGRDVLVVKKGFLFLTWLKSIKEIYKLQNDATLNELYLEVKNDISSRLNLSVSEGGKLIEDLLSPRKKFSIIQEKPQKIRTEAK